MAARGLFAGGWTLDLDGFAAFVGAAYWASVMGAPHGTAARATRHADELYRKVATALALAGFGITFFGQWGH